ncbi:MAG: hypothetical protein ACKO3Q_04680, partial [Betaproteobacteria bacterium]
MTEAGAHDTLAQEFVQFSLDCGVLKFGQFKTKAGRMSPYFFNAGLFDDGAKLGRLAAFYAQRLIQSGIEFDMIFGPAYKGIPLGAAVSIELARLGKVVPFAYAKQLLIARTMVWYTSPIYCLHLFPWQVSERT